MNRKLARICLLTVLFQLLLGPTIALADLPEYTMNVTIGSDTPAPNPAKINEVISVTYNLTPQGPLYVTQELQSHGAVQHYVIQMSDDMGPTNEGTITGITVHGRHIYISGVYDDLQITFDNANHRVNIDSIVDDIHTAIIYSIGVTGTFPTVGKKHITLSGTATHPLFVFTTDDGGAAAVRVIDLHLRADTNHVGGITPDDDPSSTNPGLFVPYNTVSSSMFQEMHIVLSYPAETILNRPRYVKISRNNRNVNVWHGNSRTVSVLEGFQNYKEWDLTDSGQSSDFDSAKGDLWADGTSTGDAILTVTLYDYDHVALMTSTLTCHVWGIRITIADGDPGKAIVCKGSTDPESHHQINCQAQVLATFPGISVTIQNGGAVGAGQLTFGSGTSDAVNSSITLALNQGSDNSPSSFTVRGATKSQLMGDAIIQAKDQNGFVVSQTPITVLWVIWETDIKTGDRGHLHTDNRGRTTYTGDRRDHGDTVGGPYAFSDRVGVGIEYRGTVYPRDYDPSCFNGALVYPDRTWSDGSWRISATGVVDPTPVLTVENDVDDGSLPGWMSNNPQPNGYIYDSDCPGATIFSAPLVFTAIQINEYVIQRANFHQFAAFGGQVTRGGSGIRCSDTLYSTVSTVAKRVARNWNAADWVFGGANIAPRIVRQNEAKASYDSGVGSVPLTGNGTRAGP